MLQQNGQHSRPQQQPAFPQPSSPHNAQDNPPYFNLDASAAAKQMAALNAANLARMTNRSAPGGTSVPFLGATSNHQLNLLSRPDPAFGHDPTQPTNPTNPLFNNQAPNHHQGHAPSAIPSDPVISQPNLSAHANPALMQQQQQQQQILQTRRRNFLISLATVYTQRNNPLPGALTSSPGSWDQLCTSWQWIDIVEPGVVRIAGQHLDLFRLWSLVLQAGGAQKIIEQNAWESLLPHLGLPSQHGQQPVAPMVAKLYTGLLVTFDEAYKKSMQTQQQRAHAAAQAQAQSQGQPQPGTMQGMSGPPMPQPGMNGHPQTGFTGAGQMGQIPGGSIPFTTNTNTNMMMGQQPIASSSSLPHPSSANGAPQFPVTHPVPPHTPRRPSQPPPNGLNMPYHDGRSALTAIPLSESLGPASASTSLAAQQFSRSPTHENGLSAGIRGMSQPMDTSFPAEFEKVDFSNEPDGRKRKMRESEEVDGKRVKQRTLTSELPDSHSSSVPPSGSTGLSNMAQQPHQRPRQQPSRRKIEYLPLRREMDTAGGRDLNAIEAVLASRGRALRDINEWGNVDIDALTMSLRSRLSMELSYSLTTMTLLSIMRGQTPNSGFPIFQCPDLLDETLDLLEEMAFDGVEDQDAVGELDGDLHIVSHRELVKMAQAEASPPFSGLERKQGSKESDFGPRQRPGDIILTIMNVLRNLSLPPENHAFLSKQSRLLTIILRLCGVTHSKSGGGTRKLRAASPNLSLGDLVAVRKDTLNILVNTAGSTQLAETSSTPSDEELCNAKRVFELLASFLVDPVEAVTPLASVQLGTLKPAAVVDVSLEAFTKLSQPDSNRRVLAKGAPEEWLWCLFEALIHRLPVVNGDYEIAERDLWLSYVEKTILAIYCIAFMASPEMKKRVKTDRSLGFSKVMLRLVKMFMSNTPQSVRIYFLVSARRAIETMKLVDDGEDAFDMSSSSAAPVMAFGMGYGELGEGKAEKGTGLLGGHREEVLWGILMQRELDEVMFSELESLSRVA